jgi:uncharacterized repeat protein (TIGR04138 family)
MEKPQFNKAVADIVARDRRYDSEAYHFVHKALGQTVSKLRGQELVEHRHINGPELLQGIVDLGLAEYGPMALPVFETWGIKCSEDVGMMVFLLIETGAFGRSEEDRVEDFCGIFDFQEALLRPYRPTRPVLATPNATEPGARCNQPAKPSENIAGDTFREP